MKKTNFLKIALTLVMALVITGVFGQILPNTSVATIDDVANYVELQVDADDWSGSATPVAGFTGVYTISGTVDVTDYDGTLATPALVYDQVTGAGATVNHLIPLIVIPDQDLHPSSFAYSTFTWGNLTNNSIWEWDITAATTATLTPTSTGLPASWVVGGGLRNAAHFNQQFLATGNTVETFNILVHESSVDAAGAVLCPDGDVTLATTIVGYPTAAIATADDAQECWNTDGNTYSLVIDLTGTPPFFLGLDYTMAEDGGATVYRFAEILTAGTGGGANTNIAYGAGGTGTAVIVGTLSNAGDADPLTWDYTITFEQDPGTDGVAATSIETNLSNGRKTTHSVTMWMLNDHVSRLSDRNGTMASPDDFAERLLHVMYQAPAAVDMVVDLFPVPNTGNIFTIPN